MRGFVSAILAEAQRQAGRFEVVPETVYFGGGTPSLLSRTHLATLLEGLHRVFDLSSVSEWTVEANPGTITQAKATLMCEHGVNRISLGVQSWNRRLLKVLGRDHTPEQARKTYSLLRDAGFDNVGIDLMFSLPTQTSADWRDCLERTLELEPDHISAYNLTYEEDTEFLARFESGELRQCEDANAGMFHQALGRLEEAGFRHYETSNYARPGFESAHNQAYWAGDDYLGLGPSAVTTVGHRRWKIVPDTREYTRLALAGEDLAAEEETLTPEDQRCERIALGLRTDTGIAHDLVGGEAEALGRLMNENLVEQRAGRIVLTRAGKPLVDEIAALLV